MATKKASAKAYEAAQAAQALAKAYDAGQAAQAGGFPDDDCPFVPGDERDAWYAGYDAPLADKWQTPGRRIAVTIEEQS